MNGRMQQERDEGPWYKQFWAWFILAPLILIVLIWIPFMTIAVKQSDDVVVDNYYKKGRMIDQRVDQDQLAQTLGIRGVLELDLEVGDLLLQISTSDTVYTAPKVITLYLDHPVEEDNDLKIDLREVVPGRYQGELPARIQHRWYVRLVPVVDAEEEQWRIIGELDLARGARLTFGESE